MRTSGTAEGQETGTAEEIGKSGGLREQQWANPLRVVGGEQCMPIIGAGAGFPAIPLPDKLAGTWLEQYAYPPKGPWSLLRGTQYLAVSRYGMFLKKEMRQKIAIRGERNEPEFGRWFASLSDGIEALWKGVEPHSERLISPLAPADRTDQPSRSQGTRLPADKLLKA
jgi:hypothetical protein